jgi:hypothetical protein
MLVTTWDKPIGPVEFITHRVHTAGDGARRLVDNLSDAREVSVGALSNEHNVMPARCAEIACQVQVLAGEVLMNE